MTIAQVRLELRRFPLTLERTDERSAARRASTIHVPSPPISSVTSHSPARAFAKDLEAKGCWKASWPASESPVSFFGFVQYDAITLAPGAKREPAARFGPSKPPKPTAISSRTPASVILQLVNLPEYLGFLAIHHLALAIEPQHSLC